METAAGWVHIRECPMSNEMVMKLSEHGFAGVKR